MLWRITAACAALVALAITPAIASASPEMVNGMNATIAVPTELKGTSSNLELANGKVTAQCKDITMEGPLKENTGKFIRGQMTSATFKGTSGAEKCTTNMAGVEVVMKNQNLPWCFTEGTLGFTLLGACTGEMELKMEIFSGGVQVASCTYSRPTFETTHGINIPGLTITLQAAQNFTEIFETNATWCPGTSASASGSITFVTTGGVIPKII